ncbi:MAG: hypothetical protein RL104_183, partial [Bacteroidota bacterium]
PEQHPCAAAEFFAYSALNRRLDQGGIRNQQPAVRGGRLCDGRAYLRHGDGVLSAEPARRGGPRPRLLDGHDHAARDHGHLHRGPGLDLLGRRPLREPRRPSRVRPLDGPHHRDGRPRGRSVCSAPRPAARQALRRHQNRPDWPQPDPQLRLFCGASGPNRRLARPSSGLGPRRQPCGERTDDAPPHPAVARSTPGPF